MIEAIREKFRKRKYEHSQHAVDQGIMRHIAEREIMEAIQNGIIIEDYPDDKYDQVA